MMSPRVIKAKSRSALRGKYEYFGLMMIIYILVCFISSCAPSFVFNDSASAALLAFESLFSFLLSVLVNLFGVGISKAALDTVRNRNFRFSDITYGFRNQSDQFLKILLIITAVNWLLDLPTVFLSLSDELGMIQYFLTVLCWSIISAFISILITLRLQFSIYVMFDHHEFTASQALKRSIEITRGNYFRILRLILSFIPMYFLTAASLMTGYILAKPYMETAEAFMYEEIKTSFEKTLPGSAEGTKQSVW